MHSYNHVSYYYSTFIKVLRVPYMSEDTNIFLEPNPVLKPYLTINFYTINIFVLNFSYI